MYKFERIGELSTCLAMNADKGSNCGVMTVPIIGVPRGGTTMVAAVVDALGVYLGPQEELKADHFECQAMAGPRIETRFAYINKQNAKRAVWGWKDPIGIDPLKQVIGVLRNPRVVIISRDILASTQGELRVAESPGVSARSATGVIEKTLLLWQTIWDFALCSSCPVLIVSYERAIANPGLCVDEITAFLRVKSTSAMRDEACSRISPTGGYIVGEKIDEPTE